MIFDMICYPLQHHVPKLNERAFVHTVEHRVSHRMETKIEHCTHHHHLFKLSFDRRSSGAELHIVRIDVNLYVRNIAAQMNMSYAIAFHPLCIHFCFVFIN